MDLDEIIERGGVTKDLGMEFVTLDPDEVVATIRWTRGTISRWVSCTAG